MNKKVVIGIVVGIALLVIGNIIFDKREEMEYEEPSKVTLPFGEESQESEQNGVTEVEPEAEGNVNPESSKSASEETAGIILPEGKNWGLGFGEKGTRPRGNESIEHLSKYNAYFCKNSEDNVLYLTFDCGYENGNTEAILDALKKHEVKATFFVVGHYLKSAPDLVKRMVEEGHFVGNHSYHHPDMTQMNNIEAFQKELTDVETLFEEVTGQKMVKYFRPPQGKYNDRSLQMAKDLGYATFFWSTAYVDWNQDKQPSHASAFETLEKRIHPGAIVLLHNTSKTNGEIMDELLTKWENEGYTFGTLEAFAKTDGTQVN